MMRWKKRFTPFVADTGHLPTQNRSGGCVDLPRVAFAAQTSQNFTSGTDGIEAVFNSRTINPLRPGRRVELRPASDVGFAAAQDQGNRLPRRTGGPKPRRVAKLSGVQLGVRWYVAHQSIHQKVDKILLNISTLQRPKSQIRKLKKNSAGGRTAGGVYRWE
jgi:hypothetical protein